MSDSAPARRPSRGAVIALVVVSLAIPIAILFFATRDSGSGSGSQASCVPVVRGTAGRGKVGSAAPDFTLPALDGSCVTLSSLRGKPVVLSFFASWCNPCEKDMPVLQALHDHSGDKVAVIGVNYKDFRSDTADFVKRLGTTFPALVENSTDNPVAKAYNVNAMPDTVFIDANGVVRDRLFGETTTEELQSAINHLTSA